MLTVPPTALLTPVMVRLWAFSVTAPLESLASRLAKLIVRLPESSAILDRVLSPATGAWFTVAIEPGEAISLVSLIAAKPPFAPTLLSWATVLRAAELSKDGNDGPAGEVPKVTPVWSTPLAL